MARFFGRKKSIHPQSGGIGWLNIPRSGYNYQRSVGDGFDSNVVQAPLRWIQRNFTEAPVRLRKDVAGELETVHSHSFLDFVKRPNPYYSFSTLMKGNLISYVLDGNGYILCTLNASGKPIEGYWVPHAMVEPYKRQGSPNLVDYYKYDPGDGRSRNIAPMGHDRRGHEVEPDYAMVHFRDGIDPRNTMKGCSGVKSLFREIFTDDEAANFTASLLRNMGIPGLIVSPADDGGGLAPIGDEDVEETKQKIKDLTTGDSRGEPVVMTGPVKIDTLGFNPQQLSLKEVRRVVEERVTAVIGIPAIVCGLGAGLDRSTFSNMKEAKDAAYEDMILPLGRDISETLMTQLLPQFEANPEAYVIDFDITDVRALQEDKDKSAIRWQQLVSNGIATVAEARSELGLDVTDANKMYHLPLNIVEVPEGSTRHEAFMQQQPSPQSEAFALGLKSGLPAATVQQITTLFQENADKLTTVFSGELEQVFKELGELAAATYASVVPPMPARIEAPPVKESDADRANRFRQEAIQQLGAWQAAVVEQVMNELDIAAWSSSVYGKKLVDHYIRVLENTAGVLDDLAYVRIGVPNIVKENIARTGATRIPLVNVEAQTQASIYQAISEGIAQGDGVAGIERRIRDYVEAGGGGERKVSARAMRIARTETLHAQRMSSLALHKTSGAFQNVRAIDDLVGHGDGDCVSRNGTLYTFDEAAVEASREHPNGTLGFTGGETTL